VALVKDLAGLPAETEWVEFKRSNDKPDEIGEYISAIANAAALNGRDTGYIVWGIADTTHELVGTTFRPARQKIGNEGLEPWLARLLEPRICFRIHEGSLEDKRFVVFEVPAAVHTPVRFKDTEFIRVGSYKKKLLDYPERERALWDAFSRAIPLERQVSLQSLQAHEVLDLLDVSAYFDLTHHPYPQEREALLKALEGEDFIRRTEDGQYDITSMGALLLARDLKTFPQLWRKAVRVVLYEGNSRVRTVREQTGRKGYANGFEGLLAFINNLLPENEHIGQAFRQSVRMYPEIAIRELVANSLIHQDLTAPGTGPLVEIFADRVEVTNPGLPLVEPQRFLDAPPRSRNDAIAGFMHRASICEERGSGIDKVFFHVEVFQLPPPDFVVEHSHTKVVLFAYKRLSEMSKAERIRACYQHAGLRHVSNAQMTNATLRERFAIEARNYSIASRIIAETLEAGFVKPHDRDNRSKRHARYVPYWA
jgi:predicted HTH transcriptional regulator